MKPVWAKAWLAALLGLMGMAFGHAAVAEPRLALVINVSDYPAPIPSLPSTATDAALMRQTLDTLNFTVTAVTNPDKSTIERSIADFAAKLDAAGPEAVGFVYFSGHGAALAKYGENFLLPANANITSSVQLPTLAVRLGDQIDTLASTGAKSVIIVVDACRNVAFDKALSGKGLMPTARRTGVLVAYATSPGTTASADNIYARELSKALQTDGLDVVDALRAARLATEAANGQVPWWEDGLNEAPVLAHPGKATKIVSKSRPSSAAAMGAAKPAAPVVAPAAPAGPAPFLDARTTPASVRAPLITVDPSSLPDFALFRECKNCPEMVVMPAGNYLMGSPATEPGREEDEDTTTDAGGSQVAMKIKRFAIARFETTRAEIEAMNEATNFTTMGPCYATNSATDVQWHYSGERSFWTPGFDADEKMPATCLDWNEVTGFTQMLSVQAGTKPYRLPSEAEWEYVARAGTTSAYPWGTKAEDACKNANVPDADSYKVLSAWKSDWAKWRALTCKDGFVFASPVGSFKPNAFGLFDLIGNAQEWVADCSMFSLGNHPPNGKAVVPPVCHNRALKGGSFYLDANQLRVADRDGVLNTYRASFIGFRVARSLDQP